MRLRRLEEKDAGFMVEWMHDKDVVSDLAGNFLKKTIDDCRDFIRNSWNDLVNLHLAIVNDDDEYLGTVSLKHINFENLTAEFAITVRKITMGTGIAAKAMKEILDLALQKYGLKKIYWCVNRRNTRALRFYDKNGYDRTEAVPEIIEKNYEAQIREELIWYLYTVESIL